MGRYPEELKLNKFKEVRIPRKSDYLRALTQSNTDLKDRGHYSEEQTQENALNKVDSLERARRKLKRSAETAE